MKEKQKRARRICRRALKTAICAAFVGVIYCGGLLEKKGTGASFALVLGLLGVLFAAGWALNELKRRK